MSVFKKRPADPFFSFSFDIDGQRFQGSTGKASKGEAKIEEARLRDEARAEIERLRKITTAKRLTIGEAVERYMQEHVIFRGSEHNKGEAARHLNWLVDHFGEATMLDEIDSNRVAQAVARRRGEHVMVVRRDKATGRKISVPLRRISNTTVNRSLVEPLREIIRRADLKWGVATARIDWKEHRLPQPRERVREASGEEERLMLGELGRGYDAVVRFAIRYAARRMEILNLDWPHVDFTGKRIKLTGKGRNGQPKERIVPLTPDMEQLLKKECWRHHQVKVFTYEAERTRAMKDGRRIVRGHRYPVTEEGLKSIFRRAVKRAGISDFRFHDTRHTGATRTLRAGKNLGAVQKLLGHEDPQTTMKYAHVLVEDVAEAMMAVPAGADAPDIRVVIGK